MSEAKFMIDRVAEAIARIAIAQGLQFNNKLDFNAQARAVLEAMREPTEDILQAEEVHPNCHTCGGHLEGWTNMIDVALKPPAALPVAALA